MSKFRENMVVGINVNNEIQKGTIKTLYEDVDVAIVEMENGEIKKAHFIELIILKEVEPDESVRTDTITITRKDFVHALARAVTPTELRKLNGSDVMENRDLFTLAMSGIVVGHALENVLFGEEVKNA
jgi:hypothetical protein